MHSPDYTLTPGPIEVKFSPRFQTQFLKQPKIIDLINERIDNEQYFYGIEISARSNQVLDYDKFPVLPLFTSIVWMINYSDVDSVDDVESVHLTNRLLPGTVVLPHFTAYKLTDEKLKDYLALNYTNMLALRGNAVMEGQKYTYGAQLVTEVRKIRGDSISIAVGAYPQGHPKAKSLDSDIQFLKEKIDCGADFVITQICFEADVLIDFIKRLRESGVTVPIVVGIYIPESYQRMLRMIEIIEIRVADGVLQEYAKRSENKDDFQEYARKMAENMIETAFKSEWLIRGVQFFTLNNFKSTEDVVKNVIAKYNVKEEKEKVN